MEVIPDSYWNGTGPFVGFGLESLSSRYIWPKKGRPVSLQDTIALKLLKQREWKAADARGDQAKKKEIAEYIVKTWGQIKGNSINTMADYARISATDSAFPFKGVASYSKVLSVIDPDKFAILDARVVVSLNAIQLISDRRDGVFFPFMNGRNKTTGDASTKRGFRYIDRFSAGSDLYGGWQKPRKDAVYSIYLEFMRSASSRLGVKLYMLEMSLFADAEELARRCERDIR